jgi:hypothetical protein
VIPILGIGWVKGIGIFGTAKMAHHLDDETVAKMGHPIVVVRLDVVNDAGSVHTQ